VEGCWRHRQEGTGVVQEEGPGRRGEDCSDGGVRVIVRRNCEAGKMSRSSSESLGSGASVCPYQPLCTAQHEVWQCVRLAYMSAEHKRAVDLEKRVCLICRERGVRADGKCSQCGRDGTGELEPMFPEVQRLGPAWMLVTEAGAGQDFYECMVRAEVARRYPGPKGEVVKDIDILFD
jgi:hypothetical protein